MTLKSTKGNPPDVAGLLWKGYDMHTELNISRLSEKLKENHLRKHTHEQTYDLYLDMCKIVANLKIEIEQLNYQLNESYDRCNYLIEELEKRK